MTRERETDKDNPATDPKRQNGQGKHDGVPHKPDEFDPLNPARPQNQKPENP